MAVQEMFIENQYYHIYNRGVEKRPIFSSPQTYERFLALMYLANSEISVDLKLQGRTLKEVSEIKRERTLTDICAYCLMPNHFHFLLREKQKGGISIFMQKISTAYTMYFNRLNERTGALFQGTYKARSAETDEYLKYLIAYVHLNPIKLIDPLWKENRVSDRDKAESFLREYKYSSYLDFTADSLSPRPEKVILSDALPEYFESPLEFASSLSLFLQG